MGATVEEFARRGYDVALPSRDQARIERAVSGLQAAYGVRALGIPTDVADFDAVDASASRIEQELGPIEVWVNGAMAVLAHMRARNRGTIANVGSVANPALAHSGPTIRRWGY